MSRMSSWSTVLASLLVGCGSAAAPEIVQPDRQAVLPVGQPDLDARLVHDRVTHTAFARSTLYTWTTAEQIDELRKTRQLLSRDESPVSGASFVDQVVHALAPRDPLAALLFTSSFARMRFAWPTPWATRAGWPSEQYGDQLIRITLRPEAWIVRLTTATGTFEVHDLADRVVPISTVLATPSRIAAIYFVAERNVSAPGVPHALASFREYALCNEAMIASWELGTDRVAHEAAEAAATVDAIARWVTAAHPVEVGGSTPTGAWGGTVGGAPVTEVERYHAALALASTHYDLDVASLARLAAQLRATPKPAALEVVPAVAWKPGTARKPPRIVQRGDITFGSSAGATSAHPHR